MDRGIPKQRRVVSDAMVQLKFSVVFDSRAKLTAFETWFYDAINGGQDFFDMLHPRTRASIQARFVNGQMGTIKPMSGGFDWSALDVTLEYWRSTW